MRSFRGPGAGCGGGETSAPDFLLALEKGPRELDLEDVVLEQSSCCRVDDLFSVSTLSKAGLSSSYPLLDIANPCVSDFLDDLVSRGGKAAGVDGEEVVFCLFGFRVVGGEGLISMSEGGPVSGCVSAFLFLDLVWLFDEDLGSGSMVVSSREFSGSTASLAEERVTLEDICVKDRFNFRLIA